MSKDIRSNLGELNDSLKEYVQIKIDLFKLSLLEKVQSLPLIYLYFGLF